MNYNYCQNCGKVNVSGGSFCSFCGQKLIPAKMKICFSCRKAINENDAFCRYCGNKNVNENDVDYENIPVSDNDFKIKKTEEGYVLEKYTGKSGNVVVPKGVTSIGADAFGGCSFTSIVIPNGVTSIGEGAFADCHSLISNERNSFYNSLGYKVIWLFDFDNFEGKYKYLYPDNYDEFVERFVRDGQKVYAMDKDTYLSMFGEWKPKHTPRVHVCFMRTYNNIRFYSYIQTATGRFDNKKPIHLFVVEIKESDFLTRIGVNNSSKRITHKNADSY